MSSKAEKAATKQAEAQARKAAAKAEAERRRLEAEAKKQEAAQAEAAAAAAGLGAFEMIGNRGSMEDRAVVRPLSGGLRYVGCFDGHLGEAAVDFMKAHLHEAVTLSDAFRASRLTEALVSGMQDAHDAYVADPQSDASGTTATVVLISSRQLHVACVGNCRAVLCTNGTARALTTDRKPEALPRGLGLYPGSEQPEPEEPPAHMLSSADHFLVVASDGVWNVFSSQRACEVVSKALAEQPGSPQGAAKALCDAAYRAESDDNIAAAVVLCSSEAAPPSQAPATACAAAVNATSATHAAASAARPRQRQGEARESASSAAAPPAPPPPPSNPNHFHVEVPDGTRPNGSFVVSYEGADYEVTRPGQMFGNVGATITIEKGALRAGVMPRRARVDLPPDCTPGDVLIVTVADKEYEVAVPQGCAVGGSILVDLVPRGRR